MNKETLLGLLNKHKEKRLNPAEQELLDKWADILHARQDDKPLFDSSNEAETVGARVWIGIEERTLPVKKLNPRKKIFMRIAAAAAVVVLAGISYFVQQGKFTDRQNHAEVTWDTVSTPNAMIKKIMLSDSSEVYLNAASSVRFPRSFRGQFRKVQLLYGEARFDVTHDIKRPFQVLSQGIRTEVLGTQFTVTAYSQLNFVSVFVTRGKVAVSDNTRLLGTLTIRQGITYHTTDHHTEAITHGSSVFDAEHQRCFLNNAGFDELVLRIGIMYGYRLVPAYDSLKNHRFTGELNLNASIRTIMERFCAVYGGSFTIKGKEILMH